MSRRGPCWSSSCRPSCWSPSPDSVDHRTEKLYAGLPSVGEEILEANEEKVARLSLDQVTRLLIQNLRRHGWFPGGRRKDGAGLHLRRINESKPRTHDQDSERRTGTHMWWQEVLLWTVWFHAAFL